MAVGLNLDGIDDQLDFSDWTATGDFTLIGGRFVFKSGIKIILGDFNANQTFIACFNGSARVRLAGATSDISGFSDGDIIDYTISRTSGTASFTIGGTTNNFTSTGTIVFNTFGTYNNGAFRYDGQLQGIHTLSMSGDVRTYDIDSSNHGAGTPIITDTTSASNATGVNMPTAAIGQPGSAWINLGGSGISITGTAVPTQTEADIVTGGKTIILTLSGDTFVTGTSSEDGIAGGSDSDKTGANKWDTLIKPALDNTDLVLSGGNTIATITLPAFATYDTDETETITWTIPSASLTTGTSDIIATPTFTVTEVVSGFQPAWAASANILVS